MISEKKATLLYPPDTLVEARIISLTAALAQEKLMRDWWDDDALRESFAVQPIDRYWNWNEIDIEIAGKRLRSEKVAIVTGESDEELAIQGAMLISRDPVESLLDRRETCLQLELLFAAPRNRPALTKSGIAFLKGAGSELLRWAAWFSRAEGHRGRLRLDASPEAIPFYQGKRLQRLNLKPIVYEGVEYIPMELSEAGARDLLINWD